MKQIKDKKEIIKLVSAFVMSDGGVYIPKRKVKPYKHPNCYFVLNQTEDHKDFTDYCNSIMQNITGTHIYYVKKGSPRKNQYRLSTNRHPLFTKIRERLYIMGRRVIDPHYLKLLDGEMLAILYMSDGSLGTNFRPSIGMKNPSYKITLNMKRYSYGDLYLLKKALKRKLDLEFNIHKSKTNGKRYYNLYLRVKDMTKFMNLVKPYILPSFYYKLVSDD